MTSAVGTKKKTAAMIHRLMEEAPLCAAAAIQRGPSTVEILKSSTSQKPMTRGNCGCVEDSEAERKAGQQYQTSERLEILAASRSYIVASRSEEHTSELQSQFHLV